MGVRSRETARELLCNILSRHTFVFSSLTSVSESRTTSPGAIRVPSCAINPFVFSGRRRNGGYEAAVPGSSQPLCLPRR